MQHGGVLLKKFVQLQKQNKSDSWRREFKFEGVNNFIFVTVLYINLHENGIYHEKNPKQHLQKMRRMCR